MFDFVYRVPERGRTIDPIIINILHNYATILGYSKNARSFLTKDIQPEYVWTYSIYRKSKSKQPPQGIINKIRHWLNNELFTTVKEVNIIVVRLNSSMKLQVFIPKKPEEKIVKEYLKLGR